MIGDYMKNELEALLGRDYQVKKIRFKSHHFEITKGDKTYHILKLGISSRNILTINSVHIWDIKSGKVSGINFKTTSHHLVNMREFNKLPNRIIILKSKPYKILKHINESDIIDISNERYIHDTLVLSNINELKEYI